jgi:N-acetylglucosaminyldiphosphoundecaprenol N-acetyl-beta-D-mannosaminyltransferase
VVTPNANDVAMAHNNGGQVLPAFRDAWLSSCDSRILRALARLEGHSLPLVTGSDLVVDLLSTLNGSDAPRRRLLVIGPSAATEAALRAIYPDVALEIMPAASGLARDAKARLAVARACNERSWDILLLCVGGPAQQQIARQIAELGRAAGIALCVGAAIDFVTGARTRAPLWVQRLSLEWAYRLVREPARLWRRYLVESPKVLRIFMATRAARRPYCGPASIAAKCVPDGGLHDHVDRSVRKR